MLYKWLHFVPVSFKHTVAYVPHIQQPTDLIFFCFWHFASMQRPTTTIFENLNDKYKQNNEQYSDRQEQLSTPVLSFRLCTLYNRFIDSNNNKPQVARTKTPKRNTAKKLGCFFHYSSWVRITSETLKNIHSLNSILLLLLGYVQVTRAWIIAADVVNPMIYDMNDCDDECIRCTVYTHILSLL